MAQHDVANEQLERAIVTSGHELRWARSALMIGGALLAAGVVWILGPGAHWWLEHVDGIKVGGKGGLTGKDLASALDMIRGRVLALGTGLLAGVAIYYTAANATSARRTAQAAQAGVEASRRSAEIAEAAQLRTFELTQEGQRQSEEAQRQTHELTERGQLTERFTAAVAQLGDSSPAVQLGGVHALAGIADDSPTLTLRQTCIDVLCAYLRLPYDPDPGDDPKLADARKAFLAFREVRHTIIRLIGNHLRLTADDSHSWQGHDFDFTNVVFDGGDLHGAVFSSDSINFRNAEFADGYVNFSDAIFSGGTVFFGARFSNCHVGFFDAQFSGGTVDFKGAKFSGGQVRFEHASFSGAEVDFWATEFSGCFLHFSNATFSGGTVDFGRATLTDTVIFRDVTLSGGEIHLEHAAGYPPKGLVSPPEQPCPPGLFLPETWLGAQQPPLPM